MTHGRAGEIWGWPTQILKSRRNKNNTDASRCSVQWTDCLMGGLLVQCKNVFWKNFLGWSALASQFLGWACIGFPNYVDHNLTMIIHSSPSAQVFRYWGTSMAQLHMNTRGYVSWTLEGGSGAFDCKQIFYCATEPVGRGQLLWHMRFFFGAFHSHGDNRSKRDWLLWVRSLVIAPY